MTLKEKEEVVQSFIDMMQDCSNTDVEKGATKFMIRLPVIIEDIWEKGREVGFKEGYREAKRKLEKEQSKLN
jgi:hypothetical protein